MGTLNEKLEYLNQTKEYIKEAIISKGQPVSSSDTFRSYASKIAAIENGDIITATNTTGSAVSADDKVWINDVITYNFNVVGNPSINTTNKTITGFSPSNYVALQTAFSPETNPWEMHVKFTTGNDVSTTQYLFTSYDENGYVLFIDQGHIHYGVKLYNMPGATEIESNTTYLIKFGFDTSDGYYAKIKKVEDSEWTDDVTLSTSITLTEMLHSVFGVSPNDDTFDNPFLGTIDFSGTNIEVNGSDWWTPSIVENYSIVNDTNITATSFTAVAQTSIENNASGSVKTILDGNGSYAPTLGTKVITRNNTYSASTDNLYGYSSVTVNVEDIPAVVESLSITPTTSAQSFTPTSGVDGYSPVTVSAVDSSIDANITAGNIKSGVEILGVEGTYAGETPVLEDKVITANGEYTAGQGYDGIGTATVAVNATGHTEVAMNRTGAAINSGDKVWVNQEYYEAGTIINNNLGGIVSWHGSWPNNGVFTSDCMYGINTSTSNNALYYTPTMTSQGNYYGSAFAGGTDSNLYFKNGINFVRSNSTAYASKKWIRFDTGTPIILGNTVSNLIIPFVNKPGWFTDGSGNLYIIDIATGEVTETITMPACATYDSLLNYAPVYISDEYILLANSSGGYHLDKYSFNPTEKTFTLVTSNVFSYSASNYTPVGITPDNKYIVYFENTKNVMYLLNTNTFEKTTALSGINTVQQTYYASTGVFWCRERNQSSQVYPLNTRAWKYNPESETFIEVQLNTDFFKNIYWLSDDLSKIVYNPQMGSTLGSYKLSTQNRILGNNLVPYSQFTAQTITGTAAESILAGATGNVYLGDKGTLQSKAVTSNGTVTPSEGYYGLNKVTVNVVGTGVEVEGKNYTGAVINEGDKVWINPYYYEAGTKFSINNSMSSNYGAVLTPDGSKYIATNKLYNVSDNSNLGTFANTSSVSYSNEFRVFSNGEMYRTVDGYLQRCDSGLSWNRQNIYPIFGTSEYIYNSSTNAIEQIDPNDGSTIKSYGFSDSNASWLSYSNSFFAIFIDKNHILWPIGISNNNGNTCIVHLDDDNNAVVLGNNANINLCFHYISNPNRCCCMGVTSDKKYALVTTSSSSFNIYKLGDGFNITEIVNSDLKLDTSFLGNSYNCCAIYYTDKDILFNNKVNSWSSIYSGTNLNNTKVYKYNPSTEEFKQVSIDFEGLFGGTGFGVSCVNGMIDIWYTQHSTGWKYVLTSEEKSGNNLVNYGSAVTSSTQTGTATESIATGATGTVKVGAAFVPTLETLAITPTTSAQTIIPATGVDGYDEVTVSAVTSSIDANILAGNIKKDVQILGVTGSYEGASINNQNKSITVDGSYTADSGYTGLGTVTVTAGAVASASTQNEIAEELMLINDGATTFTLTVSPTDATPVITSTTNSVVLTPSSSSGGVSVYSISANSLKTYSYSVSKEGYATSTGTIDGGTTSLTVTLVAESQGGGGLPEEGPTIDPSDGDNSGGSSNPDIID